MGSGRGTNKKDERQALTRVNTQFDEYKADPLEEARKQRTMKFLSEFDSGKDVKDMEAVSPYYNLYKNAKNSQANQMVGRGVVALGRNPNADSQVSDLEKYVQAQREQDAAGMLYDATNQAYNDANQESNFLIGVDQNRKSNKLGAATGIYSTILNRPRQKPLWEKLLGYGMQAAQTAAMI